MSDADVLFLPSVEELPRSLLNGPLHTDKIVLALMLSDGMSLEEIAQYLSKETGASVSETEVRQAARSVGLL